MTTAQNLSQGLAIIVKYEPNAAIFSTHNAICVDNYSDIAIAMTGDDYVALTDMEWYEWRGAWRFNLY